MRSQIAEVRRFNRLVTLRAGALNDNFLGRDRSLGASRLLYEIGSDGADLRDLRRRLGLDSGYVSRLVKSLEAQGLIRLTPGTDDERVRTARLTDRGRREIREMSDRSDEAAADLLEPLTTKQRKQLVAAMAEVQRLLRLAGLDIERVDPASTQARRCVAQYFDELHRRFEGGFDFAASINVEDRKLVPPRGAFLVGAIDGEPVACGAVTAIAPGVGYLKRMWVADSVRGLGIGRRMLEALESQARKLKLKILRLETNRALREAIHLYKTAGFREVPAFNSEPYAHHWFEKRLK
jgi:DNA-binding MarR family transcriptional regulator/GNAT superfamily N-acetyltransferase